MWQSSHCNESVGRLDEQWLNCLDFNSTRIWIYIHIYIYAYIHTYIHTYYIHTYIHIIYMHKIHVYIYRERETKSYNMYRIQRIERNGSYEQGTFCVIKGIVVVSYICWIGWMGEWGAKQHKEP